MELTKSLPVTGIWRGAIFQSLEEIAGVGWCPFLDPLCFQGCERPLPLPPKGINGRPESIQWVVIVIVVVVVDVVAVIVVVAMNSCSCRHLVVAVVVAVLVLVVGCVVVFEVVGVVVVIVVVLVIL